MAHRTRHPKPASSDTPDPADDPTDKQPSEPRGAALNGGDSTTPQEPFDPQQELLGWHAAASAERAAPAPRPGAADARRLSQEALGLASTSGPFEWADIAWDLCDAGRPHAAAAFWNAVLELYDCDARVHLHLADSLASAGEPEKALEAAARGYRLHPDLFEFQEAVLDQLFALGRDESCFEWSLPPTVVRLGQATRDRVCRFLREEGECDLFDLRYTLFDDQYVCFDVQDLARDLELDPRFEICRFEGAAYATLKQPSLGAD